MELEIRQMSFEIMKRRHTAVINKKIPSNESCCKTAEMLRSKICETYIYLISIRSSAFCCAYLQIVTGDNS